MQLGRPHATRAPLTQPSQRIQAVEVYTKLTEADPDNAPDLVIGGEFSPANYQPTHLAVRSLSVELATLTVVVVLQLTRWWSCRCQAGQFSRSRGQRKTKWACSMITTVRPCRS